MEKNGRRLIVFDVEGIILPKRRFLVFEVAARLGLSTFIKFLLIGFLYEVGLLSIESALKRLFRLLKGMPIDELFAQYKRLPLMYGATEMFEELRRRGFKTALISSGIPKVFVEDLANRLGADYASGLEIGVVEGQLNGEVWGDVLKTDGKVIALKKILEREDISLCDCIVVADDRNNLPLLRACKTSIGYDPDFILSVKSDYVVRGDVTRMLPLLTGETSKPYRWTLSKSKILRGLIHISGILIPFICMYLLSADIVALIIMAVTSIYITSEVSRMLGRNIPIFSTITLKAAEKSERQEFVTGPIFYALGMALSLLLFRPPISYAAIAILTLGDGFAAIFGRILGKTVFPLNKGKRVEGSLIGFVFAFLGAVLFLGPGGALIGATVGILAESLSLPIDDNLTMPLVSGLVLTLIL